MAVFRLMKEVQKDLEINFEDLKLHEDSVLLAKQEK